MICLLFIHMLWKLQYICQQSMYTSSRHLHHDPTTVSYRYIFVQSNILCRYAEEKLHCNVYNIKAIWVSLYMYEVISSFKYVYYSDNVICHHILILTLKLLGPAAGVSGSLDSSCSLKPLWSGMWDVVPARTSPPLHPPSPPTVL